MTSANARRVNPRSCIRPRTADFGAWGAESARYVCEIFISFLVVISFLLKFDFFLLTYRLVTSNHTFYRLQVHNRLLRQLGAGLLRRHVGCVPVRPVRVVP